MPQVRFGLDRKVVALTRGTFAIGVSTESASPALALPGT